MKKHNHETMPKWKIDFQNEKNGYFKTVQNKTP